MEQRTLGKYEIRATLGRGAAGVVYEAWDPVIARRVAIKTVRLHYDADDEAAEMLARCKREAQAAGRLNHPNIVGVFDYGETADVAYIVMEYIDGRTLKAALDDGERLLPAEILRVMRALLAGLQYSHDNGVVHRDIKPANIMLTRQGQVKIADFGIARIESSSMTQVGTVMGTPAYMSPEQFMGQAADRRTDIYSAGVLLYQMVTGERPFEGNMTGIMHKALNTEAPRPSDLAVIAHRALDAVVAKAMAKRPEDRFDSADAFARALDGAFDADDADATIMAVSRPPPVVPAGVVQAPDVALRRSIKPLMTVVGLILLATIGGAGWYLRGGLSTPQKTEPPVIAAVVPTPTVPPAAMPDVAPPAEPAPPSEVVRTVPDAPPAAAPPPAIPPVPAPFGLADARALALGVPCALLTVSEAANNPGRLQVSGPVLPSRAFDGFLEQLRGTDRQVEVATQRLDPAACRPLAAVADWVRRSRDHDALRLKIPAGPVPVGSRSTITVQAVGGGTLIVDQFAADGSVQHLTHRAVPAGGGDVAVTAAVLDPPGQRLLLAIVTPIPLALGDRPVRESNSGPFLQALQRALTEMEAGGSDPQAEIALLSVAARPAPPQPVATTHVREPSLNSSKCADIVSRVQLGEILSNADRVVLQTSCGH